MPIVRGGKNLGSQDPRLTNKSDGMEVDPSTRKNEQELRWPEVSLLLGNAGHKDERDRDAKEML